MEASVVGDMVLEAIRENQMYIVTHPEFNDGVRRRHAAVEAALPAGPGNPELRAMIVDVVDNPVYAVPKEKVAGKKG
jgi:hypothetical protein